MPKLAKRKITLKKELGALRTEFKKVSQRANEFETGVRILRTSLSDLSERMIKIEQRVSVAEEKVKDLRRECDTLKITDKNSGTRKSPQGHADFEVRGVFPGNFGSKK